MRTCRDEIFLSWCVVSPMRTAPLLSGGDVEGPAEEADENVERRVIMSLGCGLAHAHGDPTEPLLSGGDVDGPAEEANENG